MSALFEQLKRIFELLLTLYLLYLFFLFVWSTLSYFTEWALPLAALITAVPAAYYLWEYLLKLLNLWKE